MSQLYFSSSARNDLKEVFDYISLDNPSAAVGFLKKLKDTCNRIARYPSIGVQRDDLAPGLRCFPIGSYLIFYRTSEGLTGIVRVLHGSRDYRSSLT